MGGRRRPRVPSSISCATFISSPYFANADRGGTCQQVNVAPAEEKLHYAWDDPVVYQNRKRGPKITIVFESAEGLEAGKTKIQFQYDAEQKTGRAASPARSRLMMPSSQSADCSSLAVLSAIQNIGSTGENGNTPQRIRFAYQSEAITCVVRSATTQLQTT